MPVMGATEKLTVAAPGKIAEGLCDLLLGLGAGAVSREEKRDPGQLVHAYFDEGGDMAAVAAAVENFAGFFGVPRSSLVFTTRRVEPKDWENWKSHLTAVRVSRRVTVVPPWEKREYGPGTTVVEINPANAFGTGHHETTRICASYLDELLARRRNLSVFDLGCGSGVLGICAAKLGAGAVFCADTDFAAARETAANARRNSVDEKIRIWCGSMDGTSGRFDVVVSNTSRETLVSMKDSMRERLLPGGRLVVSGVLAAERSGLAYAYESSGYDIVSWKIDGEWAGALLRLSARAEPKP